MIQNLFVLLLALLIILSVVTSGIAFAVGTFLVSLILATIVSFTQKKEDT